MIKLAFIGFGKSAHRYHLPFIDTDKFEVVGYYKKTDRKFEMQYPYLDIKSITRYEKIDDLYSSDCELVVITTPPEFHYNYAIEALNAGKHVIVEKPFCRTVEEANELFNLARKKNLVIRPYQNRRYDSELVSMQKIFNNNYDNIHQIDSSHTSYRPAKQVNKEQDYINGSVYGLAVHFVDQLVSIFGEPDDVVGFRDNQMNYFLFNDESSSYSDDSYELIMRYGHKKFRLYFSTLIVAPYPRMVIHTTDSTFIKQTIDQQERDLKLGIFRDNPKFSMDEDHFIEHKSDGSIIHHENVYAGYQTYYNNMYDFIKYDKEFFAEKDVLVVINILHSLCENKTYKKLS